MVHKLMLRRFQFSFFVFFFSVAVCISSVFHINPQLILPKNFSLIQLGCCLGGHLFNNHDRKICIATPSPLLSIMVAQAPIISFNLLFMSTVSLLEFSLSLPNILPPTLQACSQIYYKLAVTINTLS